MFSDGACVDHIEQVKRLRKLLGKCAQAIAAKYTNKPEKASEIITAIRTELEGK